MRIIHLLNQAFLKLGHEYVAELYRQLLNREPDEAYRHYVNRLLSGGTRFDILLTILQSEESMQLYHRSPVRYAHQDQAPTIAWRLQALLTLDDEPFVQSLYNELLDRESEEAGRSFFLHLLSQGHSRFSLFIHVLTSEECLGVPPQPPHGFTTTREWIDAHHYDRDQELKTYKLVYGDQIAHFAEAKSLEPVSERFRSFSHQSSPAFVAVVPRGRVWGMYGAVLTWDNQLLSDISLDANAVANEQHSVFRQWEQPIAHEYTPETVGVLTFCSSQNYFHWMFDVLPRIHLLHLSGIPIDKLLVNRNGFFPFQDQLLDLIGIPRDQIIDTSSRFHLKSRMLIVASLISQLSYPKWVCDFLRSRLLLNRTNSVNSEYERIYISRADAPGRRIINEQEITGILDRFGFTCVILEALPVATQIQLFASAKVVVAPHGAGLANLAFCSPGTKVIELFSPNHVQTYFWIISNHVQLDYFYLVGETHDLSGNPGADYTVSADKLTAILRLAGL